MRVGAILDSSYTAAVSRLKTAQEHILFVGRYFLSVYKTKNIKLNVVGNGPGEWLSFWRVSS